MNAERFLEASRATGVEIADTDGITVWRGPAAGTAKPRGPIAGKRVGLLVAAEFSDFQAYCLAEYLSELGGRVEFIGADGPVWKNTRPTSAGKGVQGMWGVSLDPIPVLGTARCGYRSLSKAAASDYDALVVLGGHAADILTTEEPAQQLIGDAAKAGCILGAIGEGTLPLIFADALGGRKCTGNHLVAHLLRRVAVYQEAAVVREGRLVTARDTEDTPAFARELARAFDPAFVDPREGVLEGRSVAIVAGEDFEDIELVTPVLELLYRGARLTLATFPAPLRSRPPLLGLDVVMGNFGVSVPLQEVPGDRYRIASLSSLSAADFDVVLIPGAFCPWNMVAARRPVEWLAAMHAAGKMIAAICHGAIPMAAADIVRGRRIAGVGACRSHVTIMGGQFLADASAIVDGNIVTGRVPRDVPEFLDAVTYALLQAGAGSRPR